MKISVIVPSFNQARYLSAALDSIVAQNYSELDVRVYDGGSTDGSVDLLRAHSAGYWWTSGKDGGQAEAINRGLSESSGDILAFLNSDDVYYPRALKRVAQYFSDHPECSVLYGDAYHLHADGSVMETYYTEPWNYQRLQEVCYLCQPAVFWRREVVERYGLLDDRLHFALDYEYWLRIGRHRPFHYLQGEFLAGSRLHADTKTLSQRVRMHQEILAVVLRHQASEVASHRWLQHLSYYEAAELANPQAPGYQERRLFIPLFVAACLRNAGRYGVHLSLTSLQQFEAQLGAAGL